MIFHDRHEAGKKLANELTSFASENTIILGLAKGGVIIAYEVAKKLQVPFNIVMTRKIGAPINPEFAIGAITESGVGYFDDTLIRQLQVSEDYLKTTITKEKQEAEKRLSLYRKEIESPDLAGKTVIIVDDGIATGSTMKAAIRACKAENVEKLIIATPVAPIEAFASLKKEVDGVVCLHTPDPFYSVSQFYFDFPSVQDEEIISLLRNEPRAKSA